eukprot:scaffold1913_cov257-Pinguiococcus_pyrenoidosus.AAC.18
MSALCSVHELMEGDLHELIQSSQVGATPSTIIGAEHVQFFVYQLLRGLKFMHTAHVVHRDIKPRNLLISSSCDLKICDFGLAKYIGDAPEAREADDESITDYVATRWYRAPEVIMMWRRSNQKALDMWSVGCVAAELIRREPLFSGLDNKDQLDLITRQLGSLPPAEVDEVGDEQIRAHLKSMGPREPQSMADRYLSPGSRALGVLQITRTHALVALPGNRLDGASAEACHMVEGLLTLNPHKRMDVEEALEHAYLEALHDLRDEPVGPRLCSADFAFDVPTPSLESLQTEVWKEISYFHGGHRDS